MRLKWKLNPVRLEIVTTLTQDRYTICAECTIDSEIILDAPDGTLVMWATWNLVSVHLEILLVSVQDRYMVCVKHIIGS
jgi:hypothetical protein